MLNLWLQCYTEQEIAEATGMTQQNVGKLLQRIRKHEVVVIPGQFAEDLPDDSATEKVKKKAEEARQVKIVETNAAQAEHAVGFDPPIYNVWKQQTKSPLARACEMLR